ncbi:hypothetical protein QE152_g23165 [Popillia japonica]|uniref:SGNH hydrolase-type esterase domain-containing protein n=1 Tax=Popillia japonica TaxID=7064 RepID=A0AAW1KJK2_POPJA
MGGSNDNYSRFDFSLVDRLITETEHTNVVLASIPYRYDNRKLNYKIREVNESLLKLVRGMHHITYIDINENMTRTEYTRHGLHCNTRGKDMVAKKLKVAVDDITNQRTVPILRLKGPRDEDLTTSSAVEESSFL